MDAQKVSKLSNHGLEHRESPREFGGITGTEFVRRVLEAVTVLHARGYHRIRYVAAYAPTGLHVRVHVGRNTELPSEDMSGAVFEKLAYTSVDHAFLMERDLSGHAVTAGMNADQIADVILGAIPPIDATNDDPEYAARLKELLERFDGRVDSVLTQRSPWSQADPTFGPPGLPL